MRIPFDFSPNPDFDSSDAGLPFRTRLASPAELVCNGFDLGQPSPVNRYLGELTLQGSGANEDSEIVVMGSAIGADLSMREIRVEPIVVPEPRGSFMLGVGVLGLGMFVSTRRRRSIGMGDGDLRAAAKLRAR